MKISEIDKAKSDLRRRKLVIGGTDSEQIMLLIASHDTLLADMDRALDRLEPLAETLDNKRPYETMYVDTETIRNANQTYRELRETYPKKEK